MLKEERQQIILNLLAEKNIIKISTIKEVIDVTDMTIRRDLKDLEDQGFLTRIHGGAKNRDLTIPYELSHSEKRDLNINEKKYIAKLIANQINDNDTVFLGTGTTIEFVYDFMKSKNVKVITNSIFVFDKFKNDLNYELVLIGGTYRSKAGAFIGAIANEQLSSLYVQKSFISVNAVDEFGIYNANEEEGILQKNILNNSSISYIISDSTKFNRQDFYRFSDLDDIDFLITDNNLNEETLNQYLKRVNIIN